MKKILLIVSLAAFFLIISTSVEAQCSICNKNVMQMGTKPASGFNTGIIYLMIIPYVAIGLIGYRWWKSDHEKS